MKLLNREKNKICKYIRESLESASLKHFYTDDGDKLPLLDFLSSSDTVKEGKEEIENIVEQIYFGMDKWEI